MILRRGISAQRDFGKDFEANFDMEFDKEMFFV